MTKSFAAFTCLVAVTLLAATGAQGCGNPGDALLADSGACTKSDTTRAASGSQEPADDGARRKTEQDGR